MVIIKCSMTTQKCPLKNCNKAVRGKYHETYRSFKCKVPVKITSADGNRYVTLLTVKAEATLTSDGKLITQIDNQITPKV